MFHKRISCVAHLSLCWNLKSTFSYILSNVSPRNYLMLPDGFLSWFHEDYGNNLSNTFHSVGLVQHKGFLLSVARRFEGISFLMYNMIPPPFESWSSLYGLLKPWNVLRVWNVLTMNILRVFITLAVKNINSWLRMIW